MSWLNKPYLIGKYVKRYTYGPWHIDYKTTGVLCSDGVRRTAWILGREPDTFFTIPCKVKVKGKTVSGFLSSRNAIFEDGFPPEEEDLVFNHYSYGKNASILPDWPKVELRNS